MRITDLGRYMPTWHECDQCGCSLIVPKSSPLSYFCSCRTLSSSTLIGHYYNIYHDSRWKTLIFSGRLHSPFITLVIQHISRALLKEQCTMSIDGNRYTVILQYIMHTNTRIWITRMMGSASEVIIITMRWIWFFDILIYIQQIIIYKKLCFAKIVQISSIQIMFLHFSILLCNIVRVFRHY